MFRLITALLFAVMLLTNVFVAQDDGDSSLPELEVIMADNIARLELLKTIGRGSVLGLIYTPDGQDLIVSTGRGLWVFDADALDNEPTHIPYEYGGELALVSDTTFALLSWSEASLWDTQRLEKLFSLEGRNSSFNPRDNTISTQVSDETLVWAAPSGELMERFETSNAEPPYAQPEGSQMVHVTDEAYSMNGKWAAYAGWGGTDLFNRATGEGVALAGGGGFSTVVFSPDSKLLAVGDLNGYVDFWQLEPLQSSSLGSVHHDDEIDDAVFSPNSDRLAVSSIDDVIRVWDTATFEQVDRLEGFGGNPSVIALTPDNARIVTANLSGTAWRWDLASGEMLSTAQGYHFYVGYGTIPYPNTIDITDNAALLATGSASEGSIRLWTPRGESRGLFEMGLGQDVKAVAFSPNGQLIAGADFDFVYIWNLTSGELVKQLDQSEQSFVTSLEFAPSNSAIAVSYENGDVIIHDIETETIMATLVTMSESSESVLEFSNDGSILASAPHCWSCMPEVRDDHIFLWDMVGGKQIAVLEGHEAFVASLNFNLDSTLLLSSSNDGTIRFWDVADKSPALTIQHFARSARFSLDGKLLITGNEDGSVGVWGVPATD